MALVVVSVMNWFPAASRAVASLPCSNRAGREVRAALVLPRVSQPMCERSEGSSW